MRPKIMLTDNLYDVFHTGKGRDAVFTVQYCGHGAHVTMDIKIN